MPATENPLRLRFDEFDRLTRLRGWDTDAERARQLGVSQATLTNLRAGRTRPGRKFIDGCMKNLGSAVYDVLFERDEEAA
jgi:transcriptional regulator with XRE-family HTH domain